MLHVCAKMQARVPCMCAIVRVRKCVSGEGLNSRRMCVHKCARARPALMRSYALTFASGEGLNSLCMSCHKCPCVRSACVRLCPSCARVARGSTRAECVLRGETGRTVHQCGRARARARVARGSTPAAYGRVHVRVRTVHECGRARASARVARGSTREACAFPNASALALH